MCLVCRVNFNHVRLGKVKEKNITKCLIFFNLYIIGNRKFLTEISLLWNTRLKIDWLSVS